jgi:hypothetical protein
MSQEMATVEGGDLHRLLSEHAECSVATIGLEHALEQAWSSFMVSGWDFALLAAEAHAAGAYVAWGFTNMGVWACEHLGFQSPSTIYKYVRLGAFLRGVEDRDEQARWLRQPISHALEALPMAKHDPAKALSVIEACTTARGVRAVVQGADPDQHHDISPWRTISAKVHETTIHDWQRAVNVIRCHLGLGGTAYPSDDEVVQAIATTVLQAPELAVSEQYRVDVEAGTAKCVLCGSYSRLERHHVLPKSHQGHQGPLVWLCHLHHHRITTNWHGFGWRQLAEKLNYEWIAEQPA